MTERTVEIKAQSDILAARQVVRDMARKLGLGSADQTRLATAISELTRNVLQYAETGVCVITDMSDRSTIRIRAVVEDHGPGIPDTDRAMEGDLSTNRRLGAGLRGAKRLVQEFDIESEPGHTKVTIVMARRRP